MLFKKLIIAMAVLLCIVMCACGNTSTADTSYQVADAAETAASEPVQEEAPLNYMDIDRVSIRGEVISEKDILNIEKMDYDVPANFSNARNMAWMVVTNNADFDIFLGGAILSPAYTIDKVTKDFACGLPSIWIPAGESTLVLATASAPYDDTWRLSRYIYNYFSAEDQSYNEVDVLLYDDKAKESERVVSVQTEAPEDFAVSAEISGNGNSYSLAMENCGSEELTNVVFCINLKDVYGNNHSNHTEFYSFNEVIAPGDTKSRTVISEFPCPKESAEIRYISVTVPYKDYSRVAYEAFPNEGLYLVNK